MELRDPGIALQGMARISNQQEYIAADHAYLKLIDHPLNELVGFDWKSSIHPQDIPRAVHAFQDMQLSGIGEFHGHTMTKRGDEVPVRVLLIQNYNEEGVSAGHYCFIQSAHTLIGRSAGLLQGYELFRAALGHSPIGSVLLDPLSGFRRVNEALLAMLGYVGPELSGNHRAKSNTADTPARGGGHLGRPDTQALLSTERCVRLFNSLLLSLAVSTLPDRRYVAVSDGFLRLFGCRRDEVTGRTSQELKIFAEPEGTTEIHELNASPRYVHEVEVTLLSRSGDKRAGCLRTERP